MKEFLGNVLIQPFHCIIYMIFIQNVMYSVFDASGVFDFGKVFIAIIMLVIVYKAEDIIKQIFGLETKNLKSAAAMAALMLNQAKNVKNLGGKLDSAREKFANVSNVKTPGKVAPTGNGSTTSNVANNNIQQATQQPQGTGNSDGKQPKNKKPKEKGKLANKYASRALGMSIGYFLTGEYKGAVGTKNMPENMINSAKTSAYNLGRILNVKGKEEGMLDAYEDVKGYMGKSDEEMYDLAKNLMDKDIEDISGDMEKQYAQWLHSMRDTYAALSDKKKEDEKVKEGKAHVLELLQKHILR